LIVDCFEDIGMNGRRKGRNVLGDERVGNVKIGFCCWLCGCCMKVFFC